MERNIPRFKKLLNKVIVIDASVLIKAFIVEEESTYVTEILHLHIDRKLTLLSTPLLPFELLNILIRHLKSEPDVNKAYKEFKLLQIGTVPFESFVVKKAIKLAPEDNRLSFYDAAYHGLAQEMNGIFLTADKKYYNLMKNKGNITLLSDVAN